MLSATEEKLRTFLEKLTSALTEETEVAVVPGDGWAAYPGSKPPRLVYRLADVAVIGDVILAVTAHEIGHLLYTDQEYTFPFDVKLRPRAAHLLVNAVEDARMERQFSVHFPGADSLFEDLHGEGENSYASTRPYTTDVMQAFDRLPVKWKYILNIDRILHGLDPAGRTKDKEAVESVRSVVEVAALEPTTQLMVDHLEPVYKKLCDLMREEKNERERIRKQMEALRNANAAKSEEPPEPDLSSMPMRPDMESVHPQDDDVDADPNVSDGQTPEAAEDDGKPGGEDHSAGKREGGIGTGGDDGDPNGETDAEGSGSAPGGEEPEEEDLLPSERVKPTNVIEEMVNEESGTSNRVISALARKQKERNRQAKAVDQKIKEERDESWKELAELFGRDSVTGSMREEITRYRQMYEQHRKDLDPQIRTLRTYAQSVLRDNAYERYGGSYESGRRMKKSRLYRPVYDDFRVFERREMLGGKSYAIALAVDQSASMAAYSGAMYRSKQDLAFETALVMAEAFDGIVETAIIGFTDFPEIGLATYKQRRRYWWRQPESGYVQTRTYKSIDAQLRLRRLVLPEMKKSIGNTPMGEGIAASCEELEQSTAQVKAVVMITDGMPSNKDRLTRASMEARKNNIVLNAVHIGYGEEGNALEVLGKNFDRVQTVKRADDVPQAVYRLFKGIIKRRSAA